MKLYTHYIFGYRYTVHDTASYTVVKAISKTYTLAQNIFSCKTSNKTTNSAFPKSRLFYTVADHLP